MWTGRPTNSATTISLLAVGAAPICGFVDRHPAQICGPSSGPEWISYREAISKSHDKPEAYDSVSHPELIRAGIDERLEIDDLRLDVSSRPSSGWHSAKLRLSRASLASHADEKLLKIVIIPLGANGSRRSFTYDQAEVVEREHGESASAFPWERA